MKSTTKILTAFIIVAVAFAFIMVMPSDDSDAADVSGLVAVPEGGVTVADTGYYIGTSGTTVKLPDMDDKTTPVKLYVQTGCSVTITNVDESSYGFVKVWAVPTAGESVTVEDANVADGACEISEGDQVVYSFTYANDVGTATMIAVTSDETNINVIGALNVSGTWTKSLTLYNSDAQITASDFTGTIKCGTSTVVLSAFTGILKYGESNTIYLSGNVSGTVTGNLTVKESTTATVVANLIINGTVTNSGTFTYGMELVKGTTNTYYPVGADAGEVTLATGDKFTITNGSAVVKHIVSTTLDKLDNEVTFKDFVAASTKYVEITATSNSVTTMESTAFSKNGCTGGTITVNKGVFALDDGPGSHGCAISGSCGCTVNFATIGHDTDAKWTFAATKLSDMLASIDATNCVLAIMGTPVAATDMLDLTEKEIQPGGQLVISLYAKKATMTSLTIVNDTFTHTMAFDNLNAKIWNVHVEKPTIDSIDPPDKNKKNGTVNGTLTLKTGEYNVPKDGMFLGYYVTAESQENIAGTIVVDSEAIFDITPFELTGRTTAAPVTIQANGSIVVNGTVTNTDNVTIDDGATVVFGPNGTLASSAGTILFKGAGTTQVTSSNSGAEITLTGNAKVAFGGETIYTQVGGTSPTTTIDYDTNDNNKLTISATAGTLTMTGPIYSGWTVNVTGASLQFDGVYVYGAVNLRTGSTITLGKATTLDGSSAVVDLTGNTQESISIVATYSLTIQNGAKVKFTDTVSTTAGTTSSVVVSKDNDNLKIVGTKDFEMTGPIYANFKVEANNGKFTYKGTQVDGVVDIKSDATVELAASSVVDVKGTVNIRNPTGVAAMNLGSNGLKLTGTASISFFNGTATPANAVTSVSESGSTTITGTYAALNINETAGKLTMTGGIYSGWNVTVAEGTEFVFKGTTVDGSVTNNGGTITIPAEKTVAFGTAGKFTSVGGTIDIKNTSGTGAISSENTGECIVLKDGAKVKFTSAVETTVGDSSETGIKVTDDGLVITAKKGTLAMTGPIYSGWELNINKGATFDVAAGKTVTVYDDAELKNNGTINVAGTLSDSYVANATATQIDNKGEINVLSGGVLKVGYCPEKSGINIAGEINVYEGAKFLNYVGTENTLIGEGGQIVIDDGYVCIYASAVGGSVVYTLDEDSKATINQTYFGFKSGDSIYIYGVLNADNMILADGTDLYIGGTVYVAPTKKLTVLDSAQIYIESEGELTGAGTVDFTAATSNSIVISAESDAVLTVTLDGSTGTGADKKYSAIILDKIIAGADGLVVSKGSVIINGYYTTDADGTITIPAKDELGNPNVAYISGNVDSDVTIKVAGEAKLEVATGSSLTFEAGSALVGKITVEKGSASEVIYEEGSVVNGAVIEVTTRETEDGVQVTVTITLRTENGDKLMLYYEGEYCEVIFIEAFEGDYFVDVLANVDVEPVKSRVSFDGWYNVLNEKVTSGMKVGSAAPTLTAKFTETPREGVTPYTPSIEPTVITVDETSGYDNTTMLVAAVAMLVVAIFVLGYVVIVKRK